MLRRGSSELMLRNSCLRPTAVWPRPPLCAGHGHLAALKTPSLRQGGVAVVSARRAYARGRKKNAGTDPASPDGPGASTETVTDLEYERSLWEAYSGLEAATRDPVNTTSGLEAESSTSGTGTKTRAPRATKRPDSHWTDALSKKTTKGEGAETDAPKRVRRSTTGVRGSRKTPVEVKTLVPTKIAFTPVAEEAQKVPALSYGLDRVLFNPGVYQVQDERSQVYNFDPYLTTIMPVEEFDFDALKAYITSSKDTKLREMSKKHGKKYCGSTSSMTSILSHFHYLLSAWRKPNFSSLSRSLETESTNYTRLTRTPAAAYARLNDGVYAIDADKEFDKENILSALGKSMEKLLTLPKEEYEKYRRTRSHLIPEEERNAEEAYHYTTLGDFLMRSQLDARDPRLPGTGVFDLKTRAVVSIRMDVHDYEEGRGYEIRKRFGQWESFEREYYDLIRSAFLKYSLQVRMGRMDGIFLAYHNTQRIFGFQYISLEEMDNAIHGTTTRALGDQEFKASVALLNDLLDRAAKKFPGRSLRLHVETRETKVPLTYFFVEPVTEEDLNQSRAEAARSLEKVHKDFMGLRAATISEEASRSQESAEQDNEDAEDTEEPGAPAAQEDEQSDKDAWEDLMSRMEDIVERDSQGTLNVMEALQNAVKDLSLLPDATQEETDEAVARLKSAFMNDLPTMKELDGGSEPGQGSHISDTSSEKPEDAARKTAGQQGEMTLEQALKRAISLVQGRSVDPERELSPFEQIVTELTATSKPEESEGSTTVEESSEGSTTVEESEEDSTTVEESTPSTSSDVEAERPEESPSTATEDQKTRDEPEKEQEGDQAAPPVEEEEENYTPPKELLGMYVTVRNKVGKELVDRPDTANQWSVQYAVNEIPDAEAQRIYRKLRARRARIFDDKRKSAWVDTNYRERLRTMSRQGEKYRQKVEQKQKGKDVYVAWDENPHPPESRTHGLNG